MRFITIPSAKKDSEGYYRSGEPVRIAVDAIVAVEPVTHSWHSFRPAQNLADVHLATGAVIRVDETADRVFAAMAAAQTQEDSDG